VISRRSLQFGIIALVVLIAVGEFYQYRLFYHDDAFISLRYVHNFLDGDGLVWNAGERVEGYSNFLLVIIMAVLGRLGIDLVFASQLVGVLSFGLLVAFIYRRSYRAGQRLGDDWLWLIPVIITTTALPLVIWSLGGLETTLFALLITVGSLQFADGLSDEKRPLVSAGLALGLASLCRPDGLLFVVVGLVVGLGTGLIAKRRFDHRLWGFLAGALTLVLPHLIWRYSYYHSWLPNTYYVKAANLSDVVSYGLSYFKEYLLALPFLPVLLMGSVLWGIIHRTVNARSVWYLIIIVAYSGYVFAIGGDHMPAFRLIAPLAPLCGWLIFELLLPSAVIRRRVVSAAATLGVLSLCAGQLIFPAEKYRRAQIMDGAAFLGSEVGKYINENWPEGSLVALNTAGSTPYFAPKLRFVDMLGLNDTTIARRENPPLRTKMQEWPGHRKGDGRYILSRNPDYFILGPSNGDYATEYLWFLSDYELVGSGEFWRRYQPNKIVIAMRDPRYIHYWESKLGAMRFVYYEKRK
jgi:arabinofuranosyltransferase